MTLIYLIFILNAFYLFLGVLESLFYGLKFQNFEIVLASACPTHLNLLNYSLLTIRCAVETIFFCEASSTPYSSPLFALGVSS